MLEHYNKYNVNALSPFLIRQNDDCKRRTRNIETLSTKKMVAQEKRLLLAQQIEFRVFHC